MACADSENTAKEIAGTWERNLMSEEGPTKAYLTLKQDGSFDISFERDIKGFDRSSGSYGLSGRDIIFKDSSCGDGGRYRFLLKPGTLSFIPLSDGCGKRKAAVAGEWKKDT